MNREGLRQLAEQERRRLTSAHCTACQAGQMCEAMLRTESYSRGILR